MSIKPDYVGWSIGILGAVTAIIAIIITLMIYRKQVKLTGQFDKLRKDSISDSLRRIRTILYDGKQSVSSTLKLIDMVKDTDQEKFAIVKNIMKSDHEARILWADDIMKEGDFIRSSIKPELYNEIQELIYNIKLFANDDILTVDFGSPSDNLNVWRKNGNTVMESSEKIILRILDLDTL
ncbi:MAG: hypothetical protein ACYC6W_06430 [Nitrosotalea sp.]